MFVFNVNFFFVYINVFLKTEMSTQNFKICKSLISIQGEKKRLVLTNKKLT